MTVDDLLPDAIYRLRRFANARDRNVDRFVREVTFTDDECLALINFVDMLRETIDEIGP